MSITEFLLARIAEDEGVARANMAGGPFGCSYRRSVDGSLLVPPARVLAECEAKRRIVTLAWAYSEGEEAPRTLNLAADTLCHLASVYADHPDFDPAWRAE